MEPNDLKRMVLSIEHECDTEIERIFEGARVEYERVKQQCTEEIKKALELKYAQKHRELTREITVQESRIRREFKNRLDQFKAYKLTYMKEEITNTLRTERLCKRLFDSTVDKLEIEDENKYIAFCKGSDRNNIKKYFSGEIKEIPEMCIGGIVIASKDGRVICDNSYAMRLEQYVRNNIKEHVEEMYGKE